MQSATPSTRSSLILDQAVTVSSLDNHGKSMLAPSRRSESIQRKRTSFRSQAFWQWQSPVKGARNNPTSPNKNGPEGQASGPFERIEGGGAFAE